METRPDRDALPSCNASESDHVVAPASSEYGIDPASAASRSPALSAGWMVGPLKIVGPPPSRLCSPFAGVGPRGVGRIRDVEHNGGVGLDGASSDGGAAGQHRLLERVDHERGVPRRRIGGEPARHLQRRIAHRPGCRATST